MANLASENKCCGCGACAAICPCGCITMVSDAAGFLHPVVDELICTNCGLCTKVCPPLTLAAKDQEHGVFWARSKDTEHLATSSSGGLFGLLAKHYLKEGGVIYGAAFTDRCRCVKHIRVDTLDELDLIMRSKYVQSELSPEIYKQVKKDLKDGKRVLFSGTACQIAAIKHYLNQKRIDQNLLFCIDAICHGVPSPKLWHAWLDSLVEDEGTEIDEVNFRSKSTGWLTFSLSYKHESEKVNACRFSSDWYMKAFLSNASLRPSCFHCPSKRSCESDITLGDFWGIQNVHPEAFDDRGVSAVIANTEKGLDALDSIKEQVEWGKSDFDKVVAGNPALVASVKPFSGYDKFMTAVKEGCDIEFMYHRWDFNPSLIQRVRGKLGAVKRELLGTSSVT